MTQEELETRSALLVCAVYPAESTPTWAYICTTKKLEGPQNTSCS